MSNNKGNFSFSINFAPEQIMAHFENELKKNFETACRYEIRKFCEDNRELHNGKITNVPGAGLLLIRDFLEKKFDDPKTQEWMEKFYNDNFDRIMGQAMEKALLHRANAFAFHKAKDVVIEPKTEA